MIEVSHWLQHNGSYIDGIAILHRYAPNNVYLKILQRKETAFNRKKLIELLKELRITPAEDIVVTPNPRRAIDAIITHDDYSRADDGIKKLTEEAKLKFKEAARMHTLIVKMVADAKAKALPLIKNESKYINAINSYLAQNNAGVLANDLLDLDDEIAELFYKIDYWKEHNRLPDDTLITDPPESALELRRQLQNLMSNRSKMKRKNTSQEDLQQIELQIQDLKLKIDALI